ncbi:MAG: V-type ATP synthase subunit I [Candidatus Altiarchaeota archaeon]
MALETVRMCSIECILFDENKTKLIERLHKRGIAEIEFLDQNYLQKFNISRDTPSERIVEISNLLLRVRKVLDAIEIFKIDEKGFIESLLRVEKNEKIKLGHLQYIELLEHAENTLREIEKRIELYEKKVPELESKKAEIVDKIRKYEKILSLELNTENLENSKYTSKVIGSLTKTNLRILEEELKKNLKEKFLIVRGLEFENKIPVVVCVLNENVQELEKILKKVEFEQVQISEKGRVSEILKELKKSLKLIENEKESLLIELRKVYMEKHKELLAIEELLKIEKEKCEIFNRFGKTKRTTIMHLWCQKKDAKEVENLIKEETNNLAIIYKDENPKDAPVLLQNKGPVKNFEVFTKLFSLPAYDGIDATIFLMVAYSLFFGIVLTDAIYGIILILAGLWLNKKFGKHSENAKNAAVILASGGIFAIIFGILTGSYFGDLLGTYILGKNSQSVALWIDPMYNGNAMTFLGFVCAIGFTHLYLGYLLGAFNSLRRKEYMEALKAYISKFILLFGILFFLLSNFPILSSSGRPLLPHFFSYIGILLVFLSLTLLYMHIGIMFFTDVIGIVGNTLSYARLLAMCITTAGIALSFNLLAKMSLQIPFYVGFILAPVIFIFGHTMNILINSLGGFVHSLRLNYVEFFGTFYRGGGREFRPFKEERRYSY